MRRLAGLVAVVALIVPAVLASPISADKVACLSAVVRKDWAMALRECRHLADQRDAEAQFNLGVMYYNGRGVPQDEAEALKWARRAADRGLAGAQLHLGAMYGRGQGVPQDYAEAVRWYRRAADQGDGDAQFDLGLMYSRGKGVPQDDQLAYFWFNLAASRADAKQRDDFVRARELSSRLLTHEQRAKAQDMARNWRAEPVPEPELDIIRRAPPSR